MSRPPELKTLTSKHHVLTWTNASGRTRGLYAQRRGHFVQAEISGYGYHRRSMILPSWELLAWKAGNLSALWGRGWNPTGLKARSLIEKAAP